MCERHARDTGHELWFSVVIAVLLLLRRALLHAAFSRPEVIESDYAYLARILPFYWMLAIMFVLSGVMRGAAK